MLRLKKAILIPLRSMAYRYKRLRLFYWVEQELSELRLVNVMPDFYYQCIYKASMQLVEIQSFKQMAYRVIHTIPYHIRFKLS